MAATAYYLYSAFGPSGDGSDDGAYGDAAEAVRRAHFRLLKDLCDSTAGPRIMLDGALCTYTDPARAIEAAVSLRRNAERLARATPGCGPDPRSISVAVHAGPPVVQEEDLLGNAILLARRLCRQAGPGRILVSEEATPDDPASSIRLKPAGPFEMSGAVSAFEVTWVPPAASLPVPGALTTETVPLAGRSTELAALAEAWERALGGRAGAVLLGGPAGVGRLRVAAEFARSLDPDASAVLHVRVHPSDSAGDLVGRALRPYGAVASPRIHEDHVRAIGQEAAVLLGTSGSAEAAALAVIGPRTAAALLADISMDVPVLLVLEGLEQASAEVVDLVRAAASHADARMLFAAGVDTERATVARPVMGMLAAARGGDDAHLNMIDVEPMDESSCIQIAATIAGEDDAPAVARLARGLPMRAVLLARAAATSGRVPVGLADAVHTIAAAAGEDVPSVLWAVASGSRGEDAGPEDVEAAVAAGLLVREEDGCRFAHQLIAEAVAAAGPAVSPEAQPRSVAPEATTPPGLPAAHRDQPTAHRDQPAVRPIRPGSRARRVPARANVVDLGEDENGWTIGDIAAGFPEAFDPDAASAALASGDAAPWARTAVQQMASAAAGPGSATASKDEGPVELAVRGWRTWADGSTSDGWRMIDEAHPADEAANLGPEPVVCAHIAASTRLACLNPQGARGILLREVLRRRRENAPVPASLSEALVLVDAMSGRITEAAALARDEAIDQSSQAAAMLAACQGRWDDAERLWAQNTAGRPLAWLSAWLRARTARAAGRLGAAQEVLLPVLDDLCQRGIVAGELLVRSELALLAAADKDPGRAAPHRMRCLQIVAGGERWDGIVGRVDLAEACVESELGSHDEAIKLFRQAIRTFERYTLPWDRAEALRLLSSALWRAQRGGAPRALADASDLYRQIDAGEPWLSSLDQHATGAR